jgi:predicted dehydrogenase
MNNLTRLLEERKIEYRIDALRSSKSTNKVDQNSFISNEYYSYDDLEDDYDMIFITNPTYLHYETISKVVNKTKHLFVEKPVFEACSYPFEELPKTQGVTYVACPLRYTPVIKHLKKLLKEEKVYAVRSISSSYLPDWRQGVDYRNIYSARKEMGGGVSLDLIHEWDYITYLFGMPLQVYNISGHFSDLDINSDDLSVYIARYPDKVVELHLDYFGRKATRQIDLYCKDYVIQADLLHGTISHNGVVQETLQLEKEDMYLNEMNSFLDMVLHNRYNENDIGHAYKVLGIATDAFGTNG